MESLWLTKEIYKDALQDGRVIVTTAMRTSRNGITGYNVYILNPTHDMEGIRQVCGHSPYWKDAKQYYHIVGWGLSRPLEIILSIGYKLGLKFGEMKQNYQYL